ncbi:hypothetical protein UFOVP28_70 [uncultured Caudovirales phage]|uniref:Rus Holliday junction resolvase n=1 Tax=uncultured Caudovirales phage TaxID=2100421 RepID=A0A6J5KPS3_9CAUD|nr:hypothetical protein UFOVP28_70 [uncultured Caudovirales phage]
MGQCASKSNSRRIVFRKRESGKGRRPISIKSASAFEFSTAFEEQCPKFDAPLLGDLKLSCNIYYSSNRPDLDESLVMDLLQKCGVVKNDRQFRCKDIRHGVDKKRPRVEITISQMEDEDYPNKDFMHLYLQQAYKQHLLSPKDVDRG